MAFLGSLKSTIFDRQERKQHYQAHILGLNAYDRHNKFLHDYVGFYGKEKLPEEKLPIKTDQDTLREGYSTIGNLTTQVCNPTEESLCITCLTVDLIRFIRSEDDDLHPSWEQRLVKRYYDKLFKEYCIADMSQYKTGKIGLRWRTEKEVTSGKGQFVCGNKHCSENKDLASYEVNFAYSEAGENKQALVKLVACERCAKKLVYRKEKEQMKRRENEELLRKRERSESDDDEEDEYERSKERRKGKRVASSKDDDRDNAEDDENFDEYLQGMFP